MHKTMILVWVLLAQLAFSQVPSNYPLAASAPAVSTKVTAQTVGSANYATFYYWVIVNYPIGSSVPFGPAVVTNAPSPLTASNFVRISWDAVVGATNYSVVVSTNNVFPASGAIALVGTTSNTTLAHNNTPLSAYTSTGNIGTANGNIALNNRDFATARITTTPGINPSALGMPSGSSLPATCLVGDVFFVTTATAGQNTYGCTASNVWTLQSGGGGGVTVPTACEIIIGDTGAATPILADDNDAPAICANVSGLNQTITGISCYANTGNPTVRPVITSGALNSLLTNDLACGNTSYQAGTLNGVPVLTPGATIDANIVSAGGVAKYLVIRIVRTN